MLIIHMFPILLSPSLPLHLFTTTTSGKKWSFKSMFLKSRIHCPWKKVDVFNLVSSSLFPHKAGLKKNALACIIHMLLNLFGRCSQINILIHGLMVHLEFIVIVIIIVWIVDDIGYPSETIISMMTYLLMCHTGNVIWIRQTFWRKWRWKNFPLYVYGIFRLS